MCQPQPLQRAAKHPSWRFLRVVQAPQGTAIGVAKAKNIPWPFTVFLTCPGLPPFTLQIITHLYKAEFSSPRTTRQKVQEPSEVITTFGEAMSF